MVRGSASRSAAAVLSVCAAVAVRSTASTTVVALPVPCVSTGVRAVANADLPAVASDRAVAFPGDRRGWGQRDFTRAVFTIVVRPVDVQEVVCECAGTRSSGFRGVRAQTQQGRRGSAGRRESTRTIAFCVEHWAAFHASRPSEGDQAPLRCAVAGRPADTAAAVAHSTWPTVLNSELSTRLLKATARLHREGALQELQRCH